MQNRMWKIEFAKQLSIELICPARMRTEGEKERERERRM